MILTHIILMRLLTGGSDAQVTTPPELHDAAFIHNVGKLMSR